MKIPAFPIKRKILFWVLVLILTAVIIALAVYYYFFVEKSLKLISPNGQETWQANKTYQIRWKARKIGKVGIILIKETARESEWIAKGVSALDGKYNFDVFVWQEPRQDYKIAIFEYPWQEGNLIDYSDENFIISGPEFASCDALSVEMEWPFLPSDYPSLRKIFITENQWNGNLEGLAGADKKCQTEAQDKGLEGDWKALLGDDRNFAMDRLTLHGIFVDARPASTVPKGKTCHQLWGKNFGEFLKKLSNTFSVNKEKFNEDFLWKDLSQVWLGRLNEDSKRECVFLTEDFRPSDISKQYSFTTTCQNWTIGNDVISGYSAPAGSAAEYPICYTPEGRPISAVGLAGLGSGLTGGAELNSKSFSPSLGIPCNLTRRLICVQQ